MAPYLGELVDIKGGGTPDRKDARYWGGNVPWATVKDFKSTELVETQETITELGVKNSATNVIPAGTIVVPTRMAVGKAAVTAVDMAINQDLKALIIKDRKSVDQQYLLRFLLTKAQVLEGMSKGATVKGITLDVLRELETPLPPLKEQKRIAAILDKADAIRRKRQQAIQLADQFLRAVFFDMFGDPVTNPKRWETAPLKELTTKIGSGATPRGGKSSYVNEGVSLIRSMNVHDDRFLHDDLAHLTEAQANSLSNVIVELDDVLLNITGASVCRCAMVDNSVLPARVNQHVCIVRPRRELLSADYLAHLIISTSFKRKLLTMAGGAGATREALTKQQLADLEIPVPPNKLQEQFSTINRNIKKTAKHQKMLLKEPLFQALSQKAFARKL